MTSFDDYLYAASVVGLCGKFSEVSNGYNSQIETEEFIYYCLDTLSPVSGIEKVLDRFAKQGIVYVIPDDFAGNFYKFDKDALSKKMQEFRLDHGSVEGRMATIGLKLFHNVLARQSRHDAAPSSRLPVDLAPAADRLVTFDHNSTQAKEVIVLAEAADEAIRGANSIEESDRGWIRAHIQSGIEFIKKHKNMLAAAASALLLEPLLSAYEAVTEEPAKVAIMAAIQAVRAMFGI